MQNTTNTSNQFDALHSSFLSTIGVPNKIKNQFENKITKLSNEIYIEPLRHHHIATDQYQLIRNCL